MFDAYWTVAIDGDRAARFLFHRHYSHRRYADGRKPKLFIGPGEKLLLISPHEDAVFAWRKFKSDDGQVGINCAIFRNESSVLSSLLIMEADEIAWRKWPGERHYTYVNPSRIRSSNPGFCFKKAGWRECGRSKRGLVILEILPSLERAVALDLPGADVPRNKARATVFESKGGGGNA